MQKKGDISLPKGVIPHCPWFPTPCPEQVLFPAGTPGLPLGSFLDPEWWAGAEGISSRAEPCPGWTPVTKPAEIPLPCGQTASLAQPQHPQDCSNLTISHYSTSSCHYLPPKKPLRPTMQLLKSNQNVSAIPLCQLSASHAALLWFPCLKDRPICCSAAQNKSLTS